MHRPSSFPERVHALVEQIPSGRVTTYGTLAALAGKPQAARIVGGIAHFGPEHLPWHRVVKQGGRLAEGFPGGVAAQGDMLAKEELEIADNRVLHFDELLWSGEGLNEE